jgi:hypothetical protein
MTPIRPTTPDGVVAAIVALLDGRPGRVRLAVDGAPAAEPGLLADRIVASLAPRRAIHVRADRYWRPASLRLERGRHDTESWLDAWLDAGALRREVLEGFPATGRVLPALRDPDTDRSLRTAVVDLPADGVVVVSGAALIGRGLPFDATVHVHLTAAALTRRTPPDQAWTLPALDRYEAERSPDTAADLVVRADDPRHPALLGTMDPWSRSPS